MAKMGWLGVGRAGLWTLIPQVTMTVTAEYHVLVDTDGCRQVFPSCHGRVTDVRGTQSGRKRLVTTDLVVPKQPSELRTGQDASDDSRRFIKARKIGTIHGLRAKSVDLTCGKKGTSVVDCSNVVVMRRYHIPTISASTVL
jgi:hypothetical protein